MLGASSRMGKKKERLKLGILKNYIMTPAVVPI